jgi:ArsR family transcriptional regulator, lead/cadmium/zinc/bismuth-responsive transcriptional repressor
MAMDDRCDLLCLDLELAEHVRHRLPGEAVVKVAATRAGALSDPTRLRLAAALATAEELCVCDLAWIAGRSEGLVSHHVRVLRESGLAVSRRAGKVVFYRLTGTGRALLGAVVADVGEAERR